MFAHQLLTFVVSALWLSATLQPFECVPQSQPSNEDLWPLIAPYANTFQLKNFIQFNESIFIITTNDRVYVLGKSSSPDYPLLGLDDVISVAVPTEITELANVKIVKLCAGGNHILALSTTGQVWGWGRNTHGQLTSGTNDYYTPVALRGIQAVTDIECGFESSYAITQQKIVYAWGANEHGQLGSGSEEDANYPTKINNMDSIDSITSTAYQSAALNTNGGVYRWGQDALSFPRLIGANQRFTQITATNSYLFLLAETGIIYYTKTGSLQKLVNGYTFKEIYGDRSFMRNAQTSLLNNLVALGTDDLVYTVTIVGDSVSFKRTELTRVADAFALFAIKPSLPFMVSLEKEVTTQSSNTSIEHEHKLIEKIFNKQNFSNFEFNIEGETIYTDRFILAAASDYMTSQFAGPWAHNTSVTITEYSYSVYYSYLYYLYTDRLDITSEEALEVYLLANNLHEVQLKQRCHEIVHSQF